MKKPITTLCFIALAMAGFAQGRVDSHNTLTTVFHTNSVAIGGTVGNTSPALDGFYYEVITAPSMTVSTDASLQDMLSAPWSDTMLQMTNTGLATGGREASTSFVVNNWPGGSTAQSFIVVGWSANEGTSWLQVSAKLADASRVAQGGSFYWTGGGLVPGGFLGASTIQAGISGGGGPPPYPDFALFGAADSGQGTPITTPTDLYIVVPEPTTFTLAGLAAAALLVFRRRK